MRKNIAVFCLSKPHKALRFVVSTSIITTYQNNEQLLKVLTNGSKVHDKNCELRIKDLENQLKSIKNKLKSIKG